VLSHVDWDVLPERELGHDRPQRRRQDSLLSIHQRIQVAFERGSLCPWRRFGRADIREVRTETGLVELVSRLALRQGREGHGHGRQRQVRLDEDVAQGQRQRRREGKVSARAVGCLEQRGKAVSELSQGERQKVAIARSMMARPKLLILDVSRARARRPPRGIELPRRARSPLVEKRRFPSSSRVTTGPRNPTRVHARDLAEGGRVVDSGEIARPTSEKLSRCLGTRLELRTWEAGTTWLATKRRPGGLLG